MDFTIRVLDAQGAERAASRGQDAATLVYSHAYEQGDRIEISAGGPCRVVLQPEDSLPPTYGFLAAPFSLPVPFGEKRACFSPKSFAGDIHLLTARLATEGETTRRRNLALNPCDSHENHGFFPHASANAETRGESVFAARNAIDGVYANWSHGPWPFQSWGVNQRSDAALTVEFGRPVRIDIVGITLRADFPHDNWWRRALLRFSDGGDMPLDMDKTGATQLFPVEPRTITWATLCRLQKDENDPSPFPALTQIELWGVDMPCPAT